MRSYDEKPTLFLKLAKTLAQLLSVIGYPFYLLLKEVIMILSNIALRIVNIPLPLSKLHKTRPPIRKTRPPQSSPSIIALVLLFLSLSLTTIIFSFWFFILKDLPDPNDLIQKPRPLSTHIYDRNGQLLYKIYRNQNRTILTLAEIPIYAQQATIAIEDAEFYTHAGFSLRGIVRAFRRNIATGQTTGGSTITQQLVKNALLSSEKTFRRKMKEVFLSILVESKFSKQQILTMYLNEVSYGGAAYGIEEAAQLYFAKSARDITLPEATLLAGLPAAPTKYSPFGARPDFAKARQQIVLSRMIEEGFINPQQAEEATQEPIRYAPQLQEIKAPHFVMWVKQQLVEKYGTRIVEEGGLNVVTSLDNTIQSMSEKVVNEEVQKLKHLSVDNGAALVTNPENGEVLAMVGSANYFDTINEGNYNVTTALRQPGSSIKPVNYAYALEHGFTPASILEDTPVVYISQGQEPYSPENYDRTFRGRVNLRTALGSSLNVPAVKILASYGVKHMIELGRKMGITTWENPRRFGLSLTLGGGEVKMTDMAVAYGVFANYGKKVPLKPILRVTDSNGKILEDNTVCTNALSHKLFNSTLYTIHSTLIPPIHAAMATSDTCQDYTTVLDPRVAFMITDILADNNARAPTFGPNSLLVMPNHPEVAVKTGTTQNLRDNWAIGYTKNYVVAVWVGNNDNTPMSYIASGVTGATPIWHTILANLLSGMENQVWEIPPGLAKLPICTFTGTLSCSNCPTKEELFLEENQPAQHCNFQPIIEEIEQENPGLTEEEKRDRLLERLKNKKERPNPNR